MPAPVKVDHFLSPQGPHDGDLFLAPAASVVKILAQGLVLHLVPADSNAKSHAAAAEYIDFGGLLGDQGGLPLGQNDNVILLVMAAR